MRCNNYWINRAFEDVAKKGHKVELRSKGCDIGQKPGVNSSSNRICIKLPGKRCRHVDVKADELISSLRKKMAEKLGVKEKNWGIYMAQDDNPLKIVDDNKKISQINHNNLYFYPKIVIR